MYCAIVHTSHFQSKVISCLVIEKSEIIDENIYILMFYNSMVLIVVINTVTKPATATHHVTCKHFTCVRLQSTQKTLAPT